jgi:hypothetical protein
VELLRPSRALERSGVVPVLLAVAARLSPVQLPQRLWPLQVAARWRVGHRRRLALWPVPENLLPRLELLRLIPVLRLELHPVLTSAGLTLELLRLVPMLP